MVLTNTFKDELTTWLKSNTVQMHVMGLFYYQNSRKWSNVIPVQNCTGFMFCTFNAIVHLETT